MCKRLFAVSASGVLGTVLIISYSWGQSSSVRQPTPRFGSRPLRANEYGAVAGSQDPFGGATHVWGGPFGSGQSEIGRIMSELRETEDAGKKTELTKQLQAAVAEHFDEDLKAREAELNRLEERLGKLRAQMDRRRKAKAEIIDLQLKVLVNEAEGLGFSGASPFGNIYDYSAFSSSSTVVGDSAAPMSITTPVPAKK